MIRKNKLLIFTLLMSLVLTVLPGMESYAAETTGEEQAVTTELEDENSQRLENVTVMDEDGTITEIAEEDGTVGEEVSLFSFFAQNTDNKVVNFNTKPSGVTTSFTFNGNHSGYTYGKFGADAAYLGTESNGRIKFMLAGVIGSVAASDVEVLSYDKVASNVSYYKVTDGKLLHYVSQNLKEDKGSYINNGPAPSYLAEGVKYYSYDGHYFYNDYTEMLSDYQNGTNGQNAVNAGNRFENYFQFKNMREKSNYTGDELNSILRQAMANAGVPESSSKLPGSGTSFVKYQNEFNVNALLSMGVAINESGWGRSSICWNKNNIFGLNAVDSNPGENASVFASIDACIRDFMYGWMDQGYFDPTDWRNYGTFLGDKSSGINVKYASDPYWGEKAAAHAWNLNSVGGEKDYSVTPIVPEEPTPEPELEEEVIPTPPAPDNSIPDVEEEEQEDETPAPDKEPETTPDTETKPEVKPETKPETKPEVKPETNTKPETETKPEVKPETNTKPETDTKPEVKPETNTKPETETKPEVKPESNTKPETDTKPEVKPEIETKPDEKLETNTKPETKPETNTKPETGTKPEVKPETKPEVTPETNKTTLEDSTKKVTVSGKLSSDAELIVKKIAPNTEAFDKVTSVDSISRKTILGVFDISLTGMEGEKVDLTFNVGTEYNGKKVLILHHKDDGSIETFSGTVADGKVTISVSSFSPYVVALDEATGPVAPKTGDTNGIALWIALLGFSLIAGTVAVMKRKTFR